MDICGTRGVVRDGRGSSGSCVCAGVGVREELIKENRPLVQDLVNHVLGAGTWLDLIGPGQTVDDVAAQAGTNGYDVLTSLGKRLTRTYLT